MQKNLTPAEPHVEAYVRGILDRSAAMRLPDLFPKGHPQALVHVHERHGVSVVALRTRNLSEAQLVKIMTYRLAQALAVGFVDARLLYEAQWEHEPLSNLGPDDVHVLAGCAETGELLCNLALVSVHGTGHDVKMSTAGRPLFPTEVDFGADVYSSLQILPNLPVSRVRELGRFVKNQSLGPLSELGRRAPVETCLAMFRLLTGPLRNEVDACIGNVEEGVAKRNLDFTHAPLALLHGVVPYAGPDDFTQAHIRSADIYPFAYLVSDWALASHRMDAIESALSLDGKQCLAALLAFRDQPTPVRSSLLPPEGLPALARTRVPQKGVEMETRLEWLNTGQWLRRTNLLAGLTGTEAAVLGTFLERMTAAPGQVLVKQGEPGDALYLIESGEVEVQIATSSGKTSTVATLGPGDFFGEIALVTGGERTATVLAKSPMRLLRLTGTAYGQLLRHELEVENQLMRTALVRTTANQRSSSSHVGTTDRQE